MYSKATILLRALQSSVSTDKLGILSLQKKAATSEICPP